MLEWSSVRHQGLLSGEAANAPKAYSRPGAPRLAGLEARTAANISLHVRLADQGPEGLALAERISEQLRAQLQRVMPDGLGPDGEQAKYSVYEPRELHLTLGTTGVVDVTPFDISDDIDRALAGQGGRPSSNMQAFIRQQRREHSELIDAVRDVTADTNGFPIELRGYQVLNNAVVVRALIGAGTVNQFVFGLQEAVPSLKGGDPTVGPLGKSDRGFGLASQVTAALCRDAFPAGQEQEILQKLIHAEGRGVTPKETLMVESVELAVQMFTNRETPDGVVAGEPLRHVAVLETFALGAPALSQSNALNL